ncbi:glycosyltransferase family 2 protein [Oleiharenicola lentus]|uniref:glycosyltransferase family 2 protein n=1 Tax=Oleiharenicola lentus TaxID=2508720 RepID=UPI003F66A9F4
MSISVLILTKNEQQDLPDCLKSVAWCDDVHLFDSFSTDRTVEIAKAAGCVITQRKFDNWSAHQNWGLANIPFKYAWVLYIDADERVSAELKEAALAAGQDGAPESAFRLRRRDFFSDGTWLKHAQISPFYLRLFRPSKMRYERLVNPVSIVDGLIGEVGGYLDHFPFSKGVGFWLERHLKYADLEAMTILENRRNQTPFSLWLAFNANDFTQRRFHQKEFFYRMPFRPLVKFCYMFFLRLGFLDGRAGVTYCYLQSIYEYFIVLKQREVDYGRK